MRPLGKRTPVDDGQLTADRSMAGRKPQPGRTPSVADESRRPAPPLRPGELLRWAWRQLTSMRTALLLLFALAVAVIPGSVLPQRGVNPVEVNIFIEENPGLAQWYDRLGLFDVYATPWFAAIYLALMVSLVGCILPRSAQHMRVMRTRPPRVPRNMDRLPAHRVWRTDAEPTEVLERAQSVLGRRYRVAVDRDAVCAERGYLRDVGNLVFHIAITIVLIGVAVGSLFGFKGTALIVVGNGFANTVTQYDAYRAGQLFEESSLTPFALTVEEFDVEFAIAEGERGSPRRFDATVRYTPEPGAQSLSYDLTVNHPLNINGTQVHLLNHGYAPVFTVRDGEGNVAASGPTPFLQQDANFTSTGVVKVPDAVPEQLAFQGFFLPSADVDPERGPYSAFPDALNPMVFLTAFHGDLGLDDGIAQSVYELDTGGLTQFRQENGDVFRAALQPGETAELPGGAGSITFEGYRRWVNLQISRNPGEWIALVGAVLAVLGVLASLFVTRRRMWVRVRTTEAGTLVEVAGLDRADSDLAARRRGVATDGHDGGSLADEVESVAAELGSADRADDPTSRVEATREDS